MEILSNAILAIGLYGAVVGIDIQEAARSLRPIVEAVTVGVVFKTLFIGALAVSQWVGWPETFLIGVVVAQIDPVAVGSLAKDKKRP